MSAHKNVHTHYKSSLFTGDVVFGRPNFSPAWAGIPMCMVCLHAARSRALLQDVCVEHSSSAYERETQETR